MPAIECSELTKTYNNIPALQHLTLRIEYGKSFGLLGENGAGKSTLVRLIMGFIYPTSGYVRVLDQADILKAHAGIGYVHERPIFDPRVNGRKYLLHLGRLIGLSGATGQQRIDDILTRVNLTEAASRSIGTYSKGMQQRLAIAQALLADPELLILDEPTSGLDPLSQWEIRQIILGLRAKGKTIFLCSHYLTEVETLCDTIGIMRRGKMILSGAVADLVQSKNIVEIKLAEHLNAHDTLIALNISPQTTFDLHSNVFKIHGEDQQKILEKLIQARIPIVSLSPINHTLEEIYVETISPAMAAKIEHDRFVVSGGRE
jgi:ABC-2 type transport system ATP-binding protein